MIPRTLVLLCTFLSAAAVAAPTIVPSPPGVDAASFMVVDYQSGQVLVEENADERLEPASLTKIMTTYVIGAELEAGHISMDDIVVVSEKAWRMEGSRMFIEVNKEVSVKDLILGVIVQSGNDASVALAEHVSGSEEVFAALMNEHAKQLGMKNSHFVNSTGWPDPDHYTTARDLSILAAAFIRRFPELYAMHSIKEFTFNDIRQQNRNLLLWRDNSVDGIKTGHTESAGYCLVASAKRDDMRLISVVMGTPGQESRTRATQSLLNFAFRFYETGRFYAAMEPITSAKVWKGAAESVPLGITEDLVVTVPRGEFDSIAGNMEIPADIIAPVQKGLVQGSVSVQLNGKEIARRPLVTLQPVPEGSFFVRMRDEINLLFR